MSDFSSLLKQYCTNSGFTIYQLSQASGVNRTTIQKAVTSGRVPLKDAFEKILSTLNLTHSERQKLVDAYEIATDGEYKFRQRRYIRDFLENTVLTPVPNNPSFSALKENYHPFVLKAGKCFMDV